VTQFLLLSILGKHDSEICESALFFTHKHEKPIPVFGAIPKRTNIVLAKWCAFEFDSECGFVLVPDKICTESWDFLQCLSR